VRKGRWKYLKAQHRVPGYCQDTKREKVEELYDLEADLGETKNLAQKHPEKVKELKALMQAVIEGKEKK
jgi:arylsulfatase A-like enzyme